MQSERETRSMNKGLLLTNNSDLVRYFADAVDGINGNFRVRNTIDSFIRELAAHAVDWAAVDLDEEAEVRRWVFNRIPADVKKFAVVSEEMSRSAAGLLTTKLVHRNQIEKEELQSMLGIRQRPVKKVKPDRDAVIICAGDKIEISPLVEILKLLDFDVLKLQNHQEVLVATKERIPVCVLLGYFANYCPGPDLCRILRRQYSPEQTAIFLITDEPTKERVVVASNAGADELIVYPFDAKELAERIVTEVQNRKRMQTGL